MTQSDSMPMTSAKAPRTTSIVQREIVLLFALLSAALPASAQTYTAAPSPFLLAQNNSGAIINNACIWTYVVGTLTAATTYSDYTGTPNSNPIRSDSAGRFTAFLVPGSTYKFVYESACTPPAHGTTLKTVDGIAAVPASAANVDILGTAGESVTAGAVVYLSDGSGSKNHGQWYNADADFTYASNFAGQVGIAPSAITSGAIGSIRIAGQATGLTGLSVGVSHYVSATAGALTTTAPANARYVGTADSTTTLVLTPNPAFSSILQRTIQVNAGTPYTLTWPAADAVGAIQSNGSGTLSISPITEPLNVAEGRLTGTTGVPVTTGDVTGATSIFYTPYKGNRIALYDGSTYWNVRTFTEITISVAACTASKPYDVFLYDNAGTVTAETLAWTSGTARATALTLQDGVLVKTGALTRRYVGSYYCNASGGQTNDSVTKRFISNYYNRMPRALLKRDVAASWTYTLATIRQAHADPANQVEMLIGYAEMRLALSLDASAQNGSAVGVGAGIGEDSTSTITASSTGGNGNTGGIAAYITLSSHLNILPAVGYHFYSWNEASSAVGTTTWAGVGNFATASQGSGLSGFIEG